MSAAYTGNVPFVAHTRVPRGTRWRGTFPYHLFSLTLGGAATYAMAGDRVEIVPGDLLHFAPQAMQDWQASTSQGWRVAYLILELPASISELMPEADLAPGIGRFHFTPSEARRIAAAFREMQAWSHSAAPLRDLLIRNLLEHVLLRQRCRRPVAQSDARIGLARDFLHGHVEDPVVLADVARAAGLSRARLCALFQEHLGTTPMAYLERLRLEHAARQLLFTADRIGTIAERFGYTERGYFDKRFKRRWGMTPCAYRAESFSCQMASATSSS